MKSRRHRILKAEYHYKIRILSQHNSLAGTLETTNASATNAVSSAKSGFLVWMVLLWWKNEMSVVAAGYSEIRLDDKSGSVTLCRERRSSTNEFSAAKIAECQRIPDFVNFRMHI